MRVSVEQSDDDNSNSNSNDNDDGGRFPAWLSMEFGQAVALTSQSRVVSLVGYTQTHFENFFTLTWLSRES